MTEQPDIPDAPPLTADDNSAAPTWFIKTVGFLLLVIIAAMAGLMLQYRERALAAEAEVRYLQSRPLQPDLKALLKLKPGERLQAVPADAPAPPTPEPTE